MSLRDWKWLEVLCQDFNRARSLTVLLLVKYNEWEQLAHLRCVPSDYCDLFHSVDDFRFDYQISELLRKCEDLPIRVNTKRAALQSFYDSEYKCATTNARLRTLSYQMTSVVCFNKVNPLWERVVKHARGLIRYVLGPLPDLDITRLSPGSTYDDRRFILPQDKMSSRPTASSRDFYSTIEPKWGKSLWSRSLCKEKPDCSDPLIVGGNWFSTVPKTALTDRGICIEPSLNMVYQLTTGDHIRKGLSRVGIDLKYGQYRHQDLAASGSKNLDICTIDLSAASDSVGIELVRLLLPNQWFEWLDLIRSHYTRVPDLSTGKRHWRRNAKFSSMGNGFTFELETLLFWALSKTVADLCGHNIDTLTVYGDDIIVDRAIGRKVVACLSFFGFSPNIRKTYIDDIPFRESCGGDFYRGFNVRGYYLGKTPCEPIDWIKLANGIRRMARHSVLDCTDDLHVYGRCWAYIVGELPTSVRSIRGPVELGDNCIHDQRQFWRLRKTKDGWRIKTLRPTWPGYATTSYDRRFWTRGSIISAITLGLLFGQGDSQIFDPIRNKWIYIKGSQSVPRIEPIGYSFTWTPLPACDMPRADLIHANKSRNGLLYHFRDID